MTNETMKKVGILILRVVVTFIVIFAIEYVMHGQSFEQVKLLHVLSVTVIFNAIYFAIEYLISRARKSVALSNK